MVRRPRWRRAIVAGTLASSAYLAAQAVDRRVTPNRYDDVLLWGGLAARSPARQRTIGLGVHLGLGVLLAAAYDACRPVLPRLPGAVLGMLFVQAENALLYPGVPVLNAIHPGVRRGELPSLLTWRYFLVEVWRHAIFGLVLGAVSEER